MTRSSSSGPTPSATEPSRLTALPMALAVVTGVVALLHLLFGQATAQRTTLVVLAVAAALLVGVAAVVPRTSNRLLLVVAAVGLAAVALLGVTYL